METMDAAVPVSAPIDTDSAGRGGEFALQSVFRIVCPQQNSQGTGFLHQSGRILTAEHVVRGCQNPIILLANGSQIPSSVQASNQQLDLAVLNPSAAINARALPLSGAQEFAIGTQVSTWGFPGGYSGRLPMLSVGYLAGVSSRPIAPGQIIDQWVVNAAFNGGNSGGPLLQIETGAVIGVVSSKLAPISHTAMSILTALENQRSGFVYNGTDGNGNPTTFSEGQLVGMVLNELRRQVQLVIGMAVRIEDVRTFLGAQSIAA
jgi:S1-C subfamily serine protease